MRILGDEKEVSAGKFFQPGCNIVFGHENPIPSECIQKYDPYLLQQIGKFNSRLSV